MTKQFFFFFYGNGQGENFQHTLISTIIFQSKMYLLQIKMFKTELKVIDYIAILLTKTANVYVN